MATITMIDLLGTDNVAVSRTDINTNFQTVENAVNTLETYLDTTPAGGSFSIGSATINLGANAVTDVLFNNQASSNIDGNCTVGLDLTVGGVATVANATVPNQLLLTGTGVSPEVVIGSAGNNVPVVLRNITLADEELATEAPQTASTDTVAGTGIYQVNIDGKRKILLDYSTFGLSNTSANFIQLVSGTAPLTGQRVWIGIEGIDNTLFADGVYILNTGFDPKYSVFSTVGTIAPQNSTPAPAVDAALRFFGADEDAYKRLWIEVYYNGTNWEVYSAHPDIEGL